MKPLAHLYTYHPTTPTTAPLYAAVKAAFVRAAVEIADVLQGASLRAQATSQIDTECFPRLSGALLALDETCKQHLPDCADYCIGHEALREARMWGNKALCAVNDLGQHNRYVALHRTQMERAEMWMNSAVANYTVEPAPAPEVIPA